MFDIVQNRLQIPLSAQEKPLGGIIFNPNTIPSNHLVDLFMEMMENGILTYVKPEACCSHTQEVELVRKDTTVSTDATGLLKLGAKMHDPSCKANTEMKLHAAWQRRSLAMDLVGLTSFDLMERAGCNSYSSSCFVTSPVVSQKKISLQQILDCDRNLFMQASHKTMGKLAAGPDEDKPLDDVLDKLKDPSEILQYLAPLLANRADEAPSQPANPKGPKAPKIDKGGKGPGKGQPSNPPEKPQFPEGCVTHDSENKPLCFAFQNGRCKFKRPPGKRCARGEHKPVAASLRALGAKLKAIQLEKDEQQLHEQLPDSLKKVLQGKKLLLWHLLLEKYGYDDLEVFKFISEGVRLSGKHDTPACYPEKI
eukprot:s1078_g4.t1